MVLDRPLGCSGSEQWLSTCRPRRVCVVGYRPVNSSPAEATAVQDNLDGTRTEYFPVETQEATLLALLRDIFEQHWDQVIFGPCIEGAVWSWAGRSPGTSTSASGRTAGRRPFRPHPSWPRGAAAAAPPSS
jgi:hypothetical protein